MKNITLQEAQGLLARGEWLWHKADEKVAEMFARYNYTVSGKFGDLYGREYNPRTGKCDGEYFLLTPPVEFGRLTYNVTAYVPVVYKFN